MTRLREFLRVLTLIFDAAVFAAVAGGIVGVFLYMAKFIAGLAPDV